MSEVPPFILRGVDVLNEFLRLIHHPLHFTFTPEFLRRVKMGEESIEDREQLVDIVLNYISGYVTIDSSRMSRKSAHELLCFLCSVVIECNLWTIFSLKREYISQWPNIQHLLAPRDIFKNAQVEFPSPKLSNEISLETASAIATKYSIVQNKLKKLQMLHSTQVKLLKENQLLLCEINDRSLHSEQTFLQNMMDGLQIIPPGPGATTIYSNELTSLKNFENLIETEKTTEDLFWRWIRKQGGNTPSSTFTESSDISTLDSEVVDAKAKLRELVESIEDEVLTALFKHKIDVPKQLLRLKTNNSSSSDHNTPTFDSHFPVQERFMKSLVVSLLDLKDGVDENANKSTRGKIDENLAELRSTTTQSVSSFIEVSNQSSPFQCVVHHDQPLTF